MMKKFGAMALAGILALGMLTGCGNQGGGNSSVESTSAQDASEVPESAEASQEGGSTQAVAEGTATGSIEVEVGYTDQDLEKFQAIVDAFVEESGIDVQLVTPGSDFETVMKTRMASGDLPDIWTTHGWSVARYSEYLMPLNEESWYDRIDPSAMGVIEDDGGNIYVLPVSQVVSGVIYNMDTLTEAGVDPTEIRTLADFEEACEKVKALGKTPIHVGGKDNSNAAGFLGSIAPAMLTDEGCEYPNGDALKDGTFDWDTYGTPVMQKIADYVNAGYVNEDFTTADTQAMQTALGKGDCAFVFRNTPNIVNARNYVEGCNVGIIPIPSSTEEGKSSFRIGEGACFGIWKDTENYEAASAFLEYLAQPDVAKSICLIDGSVPALIDVNVDDDYAVTAFHTAQEQFDGDIFYDNIFDREYLPSGMWDVMGYAVTEVVMDPSEQGVASAVEMLKENYIEKYAEEHAE